MNSLRLRSSQWLLALVVLLSTALPVGAMRRGPEPTVAQALSDAALVVHATVESAESAWVEDEWGRHIWTTYRLRVASYLKGSPRGDVITLRILGGTVGGRTEVVFDLAHPTVSQEGVFILSQRREGGPLALEVTLPVEGDEVWAGARLVPLSQLAEALGQLGEGSSTALETMLQPTAVFTLPSVPLVAAPAEPRLPGPGVPRGSMSAASLYAVMYNAWWSGSVDNDGDGFAHSRDLTWDADVTGGSGSLIVNYDVFYRLSGTADFILLGTVGPVTITGTSSTDTTTVTITIDGAPAFYDFAIGVYQQGMSVYDDVLYPWEDTDLALVGFEGASYDSAPVITSVSPSHGSAGTNTQVTVNGSGFGTTAGLVLFFFKHSTGNPATDGVPADIVSWSDTRIVCTVPICDQVGECGNYRGGACSGPVWVVTSDLAVSDPAAFEVPFGFGGREWNPPQVSYYVSTPVPSAFGAAIQNAFATWSANAAIDFVYAGSTTASVPSNNGISELMYGELPPELPAYLAYAMCWTQGGSVMTECDMLMNWDHPWSTATPTPAGYYDVESVVLHEFGHWLELRDLYGDRPSYPSDTAKVMYGINNGGPDWMKRTLHPDDVAGAQWIYPGSSCTYSIAPTSATMAAAGGSGSVSVTTQAGCPWTATSNASWITITGGASGTGSGTVSYSVAANTSSASRTGTLTIAGHTFTVTQSGVGSPPVANFTWSPTSPSVGQTVQFTDTSTGSPTSWSWSFGDGSTSTQHNPTHAYSSAGTFTVTLTATNSAGSDSESKTITVVSGGQSPIAELTWQPMSPVAGSSAQFADLSGGSPTSWQWSFGDGSTSTQQNPTHAYSSVGTYTVTLTATNSNGSDQVSKSLTVRSASASGEPVFVPVSAHAEGANDTFFVTDMRVFNPGASSVTVTLYYTPKQSSSRQQASRTIAGGDILSLPDVVLETFGVSSGTGSIEVRPSAGAVMVSSRTYNTAASGTYGQYIDGRPASEAAGRGVTLHLLQIAKSSAFRANVGFCETTGSPVNVLVSMYDQAGLELGSRTQSLAGYSFDQVNDVFDYLDVSDRDNVRVTLQVSSGSGRILGYASVVDNLSSDQICVPAQPALATPEPLYVCAGASAEGAQGSLWKTDVRVANVGGASRTVRLSYLPTGQDNSSPESMTYSLGPGAILALDDVIQSEFGQTGTGGLSVDTSPTGRVGLIATSRTYNQSDNGTFGQFIPALPASLALTSGGDRRMTTLQVDRSDDFRANVGFLNASAQTGSVEVELLSESGASLGSDTYTLKPYSPYQVNDIFTAFGVAWQENARADFVITGSGKVLGYASVIDNLSNDPVCVMGKVWTGGGGPEPEPDLTPTTPQGWSGSIVVSTTTGTNTDGSPVGGQPAYVDVAVKNVGGAAAGAFSVQLKVDGAVQTTWSVSSLGAGATWTQTDYAITLAAGSHTLQLVADSGGSVAESNEGNNTASRTFTWQGGDLPDLIPWPYTPYTSPIVVSNSTGATSTSSSLNAGTTYFSWFVANIGEATESSGFNTGLYVDGVLYYYCEIPAGLEPEYATGCVDGPLDMPAGTYTVSTTVDYEGVVTESDEGNNSWQVVLTWH